MSRDRPNVLLLMSDEHSYRFLGSRDPPTGEPVETPALDTLSRSGTAFDRAYCQMPLCAPSRQCLLTGREPRSCGAWDNWSVLGPGQPTLSGTLSDAGYETALVGKMHLGGSRQFCGFDHRPYGDLTGGSAGGHQPDPPDPERVNGLAEMRSRTAMAGVTDVPESLLQEYVVLRESVSFLREHDHRRPDTPWFLCASFSRPHFPLTAPRRHFERYWPDGVTRPVVGFEGDTTDHPLTESAIEGFRTDEIDDEEMLRARAAYFASVSFLDEIVGEFVATLERDGFLENAIVVYASDHGELAGEHGLWWKHTWHEGSTRVPLVVQTPSQRRGEAPAQDVETPVGLIDLYPTLCALANVDAPDDLDGTDLSEAVASGHEPDRGPVFCDNLVERWGPGTEFRMVRDGSYKYVGFRDAPELLFDLSADPLETTNLAASADDEHAAALERLRSLVRDTMDFEAAERERRADQRVREAYEWDVPGVAESTNAYRFPDGRVVDAGTPLYDPRVLLDDPAEEYDDWPDVDG